MSYSADCVVVRSIDAVFPGSNSTTDFKVQVNPPIRGVKTAKLVAANIPYSVYNITASNNVLSWFDGNGNHGPAFVPVGNYTLPNLLTTIASIMNGMSAGQSITIVQSTVNYFVTFSCASSWTLGYLTNSIWPTCGIPFNSFFGGNYPSLPATSFLSAFPMYLNPYTSLYLSVEEFGRNVSVTNGLLTTFVITNNVNGGDIDFFSDMSNYHARTKVINGNQIQSLTCKLTDSNGKIISLNNANWEFIIELSYE